MSKAFLSTCIVAAISVAAYANFIDIFNPQRNFGNSDIIYLGKRPAYDETQFKGKNILITGGSSGMGFAAAMTFARFGSNVVIVSRDSHPTWFNGKQAVEKISADEIVKANDGKIRWYKCDVSKKADLDALFKKFDEDKFMLDYAINNAGIIGGINLNNSLLNDTVQYFGGEHDAVMNNLVGTVFCLEHEIAQFKASGKNGAIVNTASVNGYRASAGGPLYPASKFGIIALTRSVGTEYARGTPTIRVNAIAPGFTNTSLVWQQCKIMEGLSQDWEGDYINPSHPLYQKYIPVFKSWCPTGELSDPMDQANMMAFLLSDSAALITGSVFTVDAVLGE